MELKYKFVYLKTDCRRCRNGNYGLQYASDGGFFFISLGEYEGRRDKVNGLVSDENGRFIRLLLLLFIWVSCFKLFIM